MLITTMLAVAVAQGDRGCWPAPMPDAARPKLLLVTVLDVAPLPSGAPGAWVKSDELPGQQWHLALKDLRPASACSAPVTHVGA
jgi:hypothetical protein